MAILGLTACGSARPGYKVERESLPWNMSEQQFNQYSDQLALGALRGDNLCLWDLVQTGRIEDGARSEIIGEAVARIYDGWGTEKFSKVMISYPLFAQEVVFGYLIVARGDKVTLELKSIIDEPMGTHHLKSDK